jgi:hypothetical protein
MKLLPLYGILEFNSAFDFGMIEWKDEIEQE